MPKLPLCSSALIVKILTHAGFVAAKESRSGSHRTYRKPKKDGGHFTTVVVLGKKEVPRGTLDDILVNAGISEERFLRLHKKCR